MPIRIKNLLGMLKKQAFDGLLVTDPNNVSYLTDYRSRDSVLLVSREKTIFFTDSRYLEEARAALKGIEVKQYKPPLWKYVAGVALKLGLKSLGFEDMTMKVASWRSLCEAFGGDGALKPAGGLVEELRMVKSAAELALLRRACDIAMDAMRFAEREAVVPGRSELEVAAELERFIRYRGAYSASFDIIVASGRNSSLPHHITSGRRIGKDEHVYIDMGVDYQGYRSDLTRVFFTGKIAPLIQRVYKVTAGAQEKAIRHIRPGAVAADIDACAREYISSRGFGKYFGHALGHGVGLEVHEGPRIAPGSRTVLKEGMVFTVEPGVYLPGRFGVRVEDMVLVTRKGSEVLSGSLNK